MGIFARLKQFTQMVFHRDYHRLFMPSSKRDYAQKVGDVGKASVVMAPVLWIMRSLPEAPVKLQDEDGEYVEEHDFIRLLERPNPYYSGRLMRMAIAGSLAIDGNAYIVKVRNSRLAVKELWYVPHWIMEPHYPDDGIEFIDYYEYKPGGREIRLETDDVVHIRFGLDAGNMRKGLSPLKSLLREIFTDNEAANFTASLLANHGVPGVVVSPKEGRAAQGDVDSVKDYIRTQFTGDNRGEPLALSAPTDVTQFGFDPKQLDVSAIRNVSEERVTACLGIPAAVVGLGTGVEQTKVGATLRELRRLAWENGIIPMLRLIEDELNSQLLDDFNADGLTVVHDLSDVSALSEDESERIDRLNKMVQGGWLTVAEAQRRAGMEADESQEVYLRAVNLVSTPASKSITQRGTKGVKQEEAADAGVKFIQTMNELRPKLINEWINEQVRAFETLGEQIADMWLENNQQKNLQDDVAVEKTLEQMNWQDAKDKALRYEAIYLAIAQETFKQGNATLGLAVNLTDAREANVLGRAGTRKGLIDLKQQTKNKMFRTIKEGRENGLGVREIARKLRDDIPAGPWSSARVRADVIGRTEGRFAQNISTLEMGKEAGATAFRVIDAQIASENRPHGDMAGIVCSAIDGEIVAESDIEYLSSVEHPNGTRDFIPVFDEEPEPKDPAEFTGR